MIIKFRAFETKTREMVNDIHIAPEYGWIVLADNDAMEERVRSKNWVLMQYTGLKDCNGKEIYEGDIVQIPSSQFSFKVIFDNGAYCLKYEDGSMLMRQFFVPNGLPEVIGNIYENPELLKEESK